MSGRVVPGISQTREPKTKVVCMDANIAARYKWLVKLSSFTDLYWRSNFETAL